MSRYALAVAVLALCGLSATTAAEPTGTAGKLPPEFTDRADLSVEVVPAKAKWGETVTVKLTVAPKPDAHAWTYPVFVKDSNQAARNGVEPPQSSALVVITPVVDPPVAWDLKPRDEANPLGPQDEHSKAPVVWTFKAVVSPRAKAGPAVVSFVGSTVQVCDQGGCYNVSGKKFPTATLEVIEGASDKVVPEDLATALEVLKVQKNAPPPGSVPAAPVAVGAPVEVPPSGSAAKGESKKVAKPAEVYAEELRAIAGAVVPADEGGGAGGEGEQQGLWSFIATAAAWGLISLVTPCVFPMIPITVSIFLKQAHGSLGERLKLAGVYCLTIITVLGVSAFALLKFMAWLSAHPVTNVLLAVLFLVLALSLFGMYEIALPNALQKRLQARQSKGGMVGTIFGALAFTVISFTCVAPFLGGFAGISAGSDGGGGLIVVPTAKEIAGGLAFATAFAAPFFVLALVPGLMKALPRSGGWLDSVKVVMGFLELSAALKFLRTAELRVFPTPQYFTFDVVLGGWIVISAACGLYLLNVYRLPHDEEEPSIGVPRLLFALGFLGLALYLTPALFKGSDNKPQRPSGAVYAWVEAFLLPEPSEDGWRHDLKATLEAAQKSGKPVFLDMTGITCTNCRYNEFSVFPRADVREEFGRFERVQLYADEVPASLYATDPGQAARKAEAEANRDFQVKVFKDSRLPLYAAVLPQPDGKLKVLKYPEGKINDPAGFVAFLKDAREKARAKK
jgi:thiol:disulfide interchange protein DsbD